MRTTLSGFCGSASGACRDGEILEMSRVKQSSSGAECRLSSPAGSPASRTALQVSVSRLVTSVISGGNSPESFAKLSHDGSWVKTSQGSVQVSLDGSLEEFCETWPKWGILSGGVAGKLPTPERRTTGKGCSLWPTPMTPRPHDSDRTAGKYYPSQNQKDLAYAVHMWPTPHANCHTGAGERGTGGANLQTAVALLPTPTANDAKNATLPPAAGARDSLPGALIRQGASGSLNPLWVELLMGFPPGWTDMEGE